MTEKERFLLWLLMKFDIYRYLMSNAMGRENGFEKSERHISLIKTYLSYKWEIDPYDGMIIEDTFDDIHTHTQSLTDHLDIQIGFPLDSHPNYDALAPLFFDKFVKLCEESFKQGL